MTGYKEVNLKTLIERIGEDRVREILSDFSCPLNKDVEQFIQLKAIEFAKQAIAATHLVFASYQGRLVLVGFYSLSYKQFSIKRRAFGRNLRDRLKKFATYSPDMERYEISAPLIAQLAKNFTDGYNKLISGDELLALACERVKEVQMSIGGKVVYLECEDKPELTSFYERNGFKQFDKRLLDRDETELMSGEYLIQMLQYFK